MLIFFMRILLAGICFLFLLSTHGQNINFGKKIVDTLTSPYYWGRGYTNDGMSKAADFIASQYQSFGLVPLKGKTFLQNFTYPVNTFPGNMEVSINNVALQPGKDFIVSPESKGVKGNGKLRQIDSTQFIDDANRVIIKLEDKLTWSVSPQEEGYTLLLVDKKAIKSLPVSCSINIENKLVKNFKAANICGLVKGTLYPDSIIFITAHYDHLGGMGSTTYFPGANDNASGIALLLNLAKYYSTHPQTYSIGFICFAGEEAGLVGSKYYTENPLLPLKNIRFLINTDLAGTGEEGITVVNAYEFPQEFTLLNIVNDEHKLLTKINARGKAANSDHYFFSEKGVHSFFFYTLGGIKAYHDVYDKAETLSLNEHEDLNLLLIKFIEKLILK